MSEREPPRRGVMGEETVMAENKTGTVQYGVKMFVYIAGTFAILASIVGTVLKLSAGTTSGLFFPLTTIVIAVVCIVLVRRTPNAR